MRISGLVNVRISECENLGMSELVNVRIWE